jgi:hypothetical protein
MGAPVVHFEIMGGEGHALEAFYGELFGWKINSNNPMNYGIIDTGGGPGGINGGVGPANNGGQRVSIYAQVSICKQRWIGQRNSAARRFCRQPKSPAALSWPCSLIQPAMSPDSF